MKTKILPLSSSTNHGKPTSDSQVLDNLIGKLELARRLSVSVGFVNKLMNDGLPHFKIGRSVRFAEGEITVWLAKRKQA